MRMKSGWLAAAMALACLVLSGCITANNPSAASTSFMWIATAGDQMVRSYEIDLTTGVVTQTGNAVATGVQPQAMAATPDGRTLFIANSGDSTINSYTIHSSDGTLTSQTSTSSSGQFPVALAMDPSGSFLFAIDQVSADISAYKVSANSLTALGATPLQTPAATTNSLPTALAVSPTGGFLYVSDSRNNTVLGFSYDSNGTVTPLPAPNPNPCGAGAPGYCVTVGSSPSGLAFSRCAGVTSVTTTCATRDDNNLFVSNSGSNTITIFTACIQTSATCTAPNGTLTEIPSGSPVAACCGPSAFVINPVGNSVYVLLPGANQIGEFDYSPVTGVLTPQSPAAISAGVGPFSIGITANTSNTNWVYVTNTGASSVSAYAISSGKLVGLSTGPILVPGQPTAILVR
jgi:6-phosphogluconolactonase (cycloisomerase 2 family)